MKTLLSTSAVIAALTLSACAPAPEPVSNQNYGGKVNASHSASQTTTAGATTRFRGCPEWAPKIYRGNMYCLDQYPY